MCLPQKEDLPFRRTRKQAASQLGLDNNLGDNARSKGQPAAVASPPSWAAAARIASMHFCGSASTWAGVK